MQRLSISLHALEGANLGELVGLGNTPAGGADVIEELVAGLTTPESEIGRDAMIVRLEALSILGLRARPAAHAIYEKGKRNPSNANFIQDTLRSVAPKMEQQADELRAIYDRLNATPYE